MTNENILFENEYLKVTTHNNDVYLETFRKGFPLEQLNSLLSSHPQIEITSFTVLRNAINNAPQTHELIGKLKERIVIDIIDHELKAILIYNLSKEELDISHREDLIKETSQKLKDKGIIYGVKSEIFLKELSYGTHYVIAEGTAPVNGVDSIIHMYEMQEATPEIHENGNVDFYELKLINRVKAGDWLGERLDATRGVPGQSVKGAEIKAYDGKNISLQYDKNTVMEVYENGKTTLYSRINGAVNYIDGKITVSNHLEINGDVDFKTGNIKFDGYLSIKGTVSDGFLVMATKDIEINGELGLGNVKGIISTEGSIFIKGGIASKGKVEIKAAKNIFTKFVENATIICGETLHIGFYCINSAVEAREVILDSSNGQIIGGSIKAQVKVLAPILGSDMEKRTIIEITGFDRVSMKEELSTSLQKINELKEEQQKLKQILSRLNEQGQLNPFQRKEYNDSLERLVTIKELVKDLDGKRKEISEYLKARGEGEICITKKIYPNCQLIIKKNHLDFSVPTAATSIFFQDGELKQS